MKTVTFKSLFVTFYPILMSFNVSAQDLTGTRIDVRGVHYSDKMWIFTVNSCTYNFDNGFDGTKMFGSPITPQLFAMETDGNYQIDAIPDINNTYLGFWAGIDTVYTMTFTHQNLSVHYQQLYLIDSVANKTVDIYQTGTTYTFKAFTTPDPVRRFKIVTSNPAIITSTDGKTVNSTKTLRIYSSGKTIYIENAGLQKGKITLYDIGTGKVVLTKEFMANNTSTINAHVPAGNYIVSAVDPSGSIKVKLILQ